MKLTKYLHLLLIYAAVLILPACQSSNDENQNIIAKIGKNYTITFDDLRKYVFDWLYIKKYPEKTEAYNKALDAMITNQLKRFDFFDRGLNKNSELVENIRRTISEELVVEYFNTQILSKYTSEENARKAYQRMDKEVVYRQIVLYKPEKANSRQIDSIKNLATKVKSEIDGGQDFGKLVGQYSQHVESVNANGFVRPIDWEQSISDPIANTIFNLAAGDVRILEAYNAFYIIKVAEVNKVDVEPFDKIKDDIIAKLKTGYYDAALKEYDDIKKSMVDENSLKWNEKTLGQIVTWSKLSKFYTGEYKQILQDEITKGNNPVILTYANGELDLKEFLRLLNEVLILKSSENTSEKNIKDFILDAVRTDKIVKIAEELNLEGNIFNALTKNSILKNRLVWLYDQAVIETQIPAADEAALQKFYDEQKDSLYYQLDKINLYAIVFSEKEKADEAMRKINEGTPFEKVENKLFVKTYLRDREGNYESFLSREKPYLAEAGFKLALNEIAGPVEYFDPEKGQQFAIIKCIGKVNQKQLTYDEVKNRIAEDFKNYHRQKISDEVEKQLKSKYGVEVYEDVLSNKISTEN
jgi:hypothetical protein